jgi:thiol-disulfide isomerase/thioredoxin
MSNAKPSRPTKKPNRPPSAQKTGRRIPILPIVFIVLAVLLVVAVAFTGGGAKNDEERIAEAAGTPVLDGEGLPPFSDTAPDTSVGSVAPTVSGTDFSDAAVSLTHDGTPKVVVFLAHWCSVCQGEVPLVQSWLDSGGGVEGVDIVSVATSYNPARGNWPPSDWLDDEGWTSPVIRDDADFTLYRAFGAGPFPYWVFLNGDGTVAGRLAGRLEIGELESLMVGLRNA